MAFQDKGGRGLDLGMVGGTLRRGEGKVLVMSIESIERRLSMYDSRMEEGDGDGSLIGATFIIAKARGADIRALLEIAKAARTLVGPDRLIRSALKSDDVDVLAHLLMELENAL